jgi:hypothetical protein
MRWFARIIYDLSEAQLAVCLTREHCDLVLDRSWKIGLLPFLGYESRARGDGLVAAGDAPERGLPYLGLDAPMGETAPAWVRMTA